METGVRLQKGATAAASITASCPLSFGREIEIAESEEASKETGLWLTGNMRLAEGKVAGDKQTLLRLADESATMPSQKGDDVIELRLDCADGTHEIEFESAGDRRLRHLVVRKTRGISFMGSRCPKT